MQRAKKEKLKKANQAREGKSEAEIAELDFNDHVLEKVKKRANTLHHDQFPEEFDFMYDSLSDAKDRRRGINPMSQDYIDKVNSKRARLGVTALAENGKSVSMDTYKICLEEAKRQVSSEMGIEIPEIN